LIVAIGLGTLLAAPLILEFLRILSLSFRGHWGYSAGESMIGSWHPIRALEWFLPLGFGPPSLGFWGFRFHSGNLPLLYSLSPGFIAMALAMAGYRARGPLVKWASWMAAAGVFLALGNLNPVVSILMKLPGAGMFRLPVKFWLLVAIGGSLLAALGVERSLARNESGALTRSMGLLAGLVGALWLVLAGAPDLVEGLLGEWLPSVFPASPADERLRLAGLALLSLLLAGLSLLIVRVGRGRLKWVVPALLLLHVSSQLFFLRPLFESDEIDAYRKPSPAAEIIPEGGRVVHGSASRLFGSTTLDPRAFPTLSLRWSQRSMFRDFYPVAGIMAGRKYEYVLTPEGLDSFLTRVSVEAIRELKDSDRLRVLAASGVEWLILERRLDADALSLGSVELAGQFETDGDPVYVYRLTRTAAEAQFVGMLHPSDHLNEAIGTLLRPEFDPLKEAVLQGRVEPGSGGRGTVVTRVSEAERMVWEVESSGDGALLVQRSHLPLYRATIDGQPAPIYVANLSRMAILLEPGTHTVELWVDRGRFRLGLVLSAAAVVMLVLLTRSGTLAKRLWGLPGKTESNDARGSGRQAD
jgi:hypothetical protein